MQQTDMITPTATAVVVLAPAMNRTLSHVVVNNTNDATVYLRIADSLNADGSSAGPSQAIPIGPLAWGTVVVGRRFVHAVFTCSTAADGTGDPSTDVEVSPSWT